MNLDIFVNFDNFLWVPIQLVVAGFRLATILQVVGKEELLLVLATGEVLECLLALLHDEELLLLGEGDHGNAHLDGPHWKILKYYKI